MAICKRALSLLPSSANVSSGPAGFNTPADAAGIRADMEWAPPQSGAFLAVISITNAIGGADEVAVSISKTPRMVKCVAPASAQCTGCGRAGVAGASVRIGAGSEYLRNQNDEGKK